MPCCVFGTLDPAPYYQKAEQIFPHYGVLLGHQMVLKSLLEAVNMICLVIMVLLSSGVSPYLEINHYPEKNKCYSFDISAGILGKGFLLKKPALANCQG